MSPEPGRPRDARPRVAARRSPARARATPTSSACRSTASTRPAPCSSARAPARPPPASRSAPSRAPSSPSSASALVAHTLAIGPVRVPEGAPAAAARRRRRASTPIRCAASTPRRRAAHGRRGRRAPTRTATRSAASSRCSPTACRPGSARYVHWDRRLDAQLAAALMGIQAIKGVEVGDGFLTTTRRGSDAHDELVTGRRPHRARERPGRRHRGRHVHGHGAARARRHEADRDGAARPAHGRRRHRRGRRRPTTSAPTSARCPRPASSPRRWSRSSLAERRAREVRRRLGAPRPGATSRRTSRRSPTRSARRARRRRLRPIVSDGVRLPLPVVLIGPMGAGKSRVGKRLAASVGAPFIDTDQRDRRRARADRRDLRPRTGEAALPQRSSARPSPRRCASEAVVSLGGGAVLDADTRDDLADAARRAAHASRAEAVAPRLGGGKRPLIAEGGIDAWTAHPRRARAPIYEELADVDIDTSRRSVDAHRRRDRRVVRGGAR